MRVIISITDFNLVSQRDEPMADFDINSVFDDIVLSEEKCVDRGFAEGYKEGQSRGRREGAELGRKQGQLIGTEVGFYLGFLAQFRPVYSEQTDKKSEKIKSALDKLDRLCGEFPRYNTSEGFEDKLEEIRAKFRVLCSLLKISPEVGDSSRW